MALERAVGSRKYYSYDQHKTYEIILRQKPALHPDKGLVNGNSLRVWFHGKEGGREVSVLRRVLTDRLEAILTGYSILAANLRSISRWL